jgi:hypothetical protein
MPAVLTPTTTQYPTVLAAGAGAMSHAGAAFDNHDDWETAHNDSVPAQAAAPAAAAAAAEAAAEAEVQSDDDVEVAIIL